MIRDGDDVKIIDNKTKEDLTTVTLAQIIFEEEKKQRSFLSLQTMRNIIQNGGESFANLMNEAQRRVTSILPLRKEGEEIAGEGIEPNLVAEHAAGDGIAGAGIDADAVGAGAEDGDQLGKPREGLSSVRELREWIQQSQRAIEEWHRRVDGRIRHVVEGISPFGGLQKDVRTLVTRITDLEAKLLRLGRQGGDSAQAASEPAEQGAPQASEPAEQGAQAAAESQPAEHAAVGSSAAADRAVSGVPGEQPATGDVDA
jgi:hypothetical protein